MSQLLTVKQAAYILKIHPLTIRRYIREKKLRAIKAGGNIRIREEDLDNMSQEVTEQSKQRPIIKKVESKVFTFEDPLWKLDGRTASLSLPEAE